MDLRADDAAKYGGTPQKLPHSDLPTHSDIARAFYQHSKDKNFSKSVSSVKEELAFVWRQCSPLLPLKKDKAVVSQIQHFLSSVKQFNLAHQPPKALREKLDSIKDRLFDISACKCDLPVAGCDDIQVKCSSDSCDSLHIVCLCPRDFKAGFPDSRIFRYFSQK